MTASKDRALGEDGGMIRGPTLLLAAGALAVLPVTAQEAVEIERGTTVQRPFTLIYPATMTLGPRAASDAFTSVVGGSSGPWWCTLRIYTDGPETWDAQAALARFDRASQEAHRNNMFPGIQITAVGMSAFQSGPAIRWEAESASSAAGWPAYIVGMEAKGSGREYRLTCLADLVRRSEVVEIFDFIGRNFSAHSDARCCVEAVRN